jgi:anaerobic magnesium-protoporphyrin IX monomethyl ester cyclase
LGEKQNWVDSQDLAMLYKGPYSTHFYRQLHRVVHKEFRVLKQHQFSNSPDRNHSLSVESSKYKILLPAIRKILDKISLPVDRLILSLYEHLPHKGLKTIPPELSPEEAAQPTPSERHGSSLGG